MSILKIHLKENTQIEVNKIHLKPINLSTLTWCFYMIEKGEELWLMLIIHIISKRNDSVNNILLCILHDRVSVYLAFISFIYLLGSANILKLSVSYKKSVTNRLLTKTITHLK